MNKLAKKGWMTPSFFNSRDEFLTPFDKLFDELAKRNMPSFGEEFGIDFFERGSYPKVNVIDADDSIKIEAEILGFSKDDVDIKVTDNQVLTISGESKETTEDNTKYLRRELKRSSFKRSFKLTEKLSIDQIDAEFKNGLLIISIPKSEPSSPKVIDVKIK